MAIRSSYQAGRLVMHVCVACFILVTSAGCFEDLGVPEDQDNGPGLPDPGTSAAVSMGPDGSGTMQLGEAVVAFTVVDTQGQPMVGSNAATLLGDGLLLIAVTDPQNRFPPAMTAVSTGLFDPPGAAFEASSSGSARRKAITVSYVGPGTISVVASMERSTVAVRETDVTSQMVDQMETDSALSLDCDAELDLDADLQSLPATGRVIVLLDALQVLAMTGTADPADIFVTLEAETDVVSTDFLTGCDLPIGESGNELGTFFVRAIE